MIKRLLNYLKRKKPIEMPKNLWECLNLLDQTVPETEKEVLRNTSTANFHFTTGRWMRNNWGLWDENSDLHKWFKAQGIWHSDDMSGIILTSFKRYIRNQPIDLDEQIERYLRYWRDYDKNIKAGTLVVKLDNDGEIVVYQGDINVPSSG